MSERPATHEARIAPIAQEVLRTFEIISNAAAQALQRPSPQPDAIINASEASVRTLLDIGQEVRNGYRQLAIEPAISRIDVESDGEGSTYYVCRATPIAAIPNFSSYRAPAGRLAALPIGATLELPNGKQLTVVSRARLGPLLTTAGWDAVNTVFQDANIGPLSIESLRALLEQPIFDDDSKDLVAIILAEEAAAANVIEGIRRSVITQMGLRDQPVLDQFQDEIFRLPLDTRLLLAGPPGTGKTTTLIRRLGQKLDSQYLESEEQKIVKAVEDALGINHRDSWIMFTPTELLRQYLKEAFAREGIAASDLRIKTWEEQRRELARVTFPILKNQSGGGLFVLKDDAETLQDSSIENTVSWFADFQEWQDSVFRKGFSESASRLEASENRNAADLGRKLVALLEQPGLAEVVTFFSEVTKESAEVNRLVQSLRDTVDGRIKVTLNGELNRNRLFIDELREFLDSEASASQGPEPTEDEEEDLEEDELGSRTARSEAVTSFARSVRALGRSVATGRQLQRGGRNSRVVAWLGNRLPNEVDLQLIGQSLLALTDLRKFANPVRLYVDGMSRRYRAFRRQRVEEGMWYRKGFRPQDIHPLEVDCVLLAILRSTTELLSRPNVRRNLDSTTWSSLKPSLEIMRNQVLVDEVSDFSPLQVACMSALTQRRLRSFFSCGDFDQRLTKWGLRSIEELRWAIPDIEVRKVVVAYRQSKQLHDLAVAMKRGAASETPRPDHAYSDAVAPALLENAGFDASISWLAARIAEIERFVGLLPSTAIFVTEEAMVSPVASALGAALVEANVVVTPCHEGQAVGQESSVRVFAVEHIKGLEFEAAFFLDVGRLAEREPGLFENYVYVGITRAATYLGLTCELKLPEALEHLRNHFVQGWPPTI